MNMFGKMVKKWKKIILKKNNNKIKMESEKVYTCDIGFASGEYYVSMTILAKTVDEAKEKVMEKWMEVYDEMKEKIYYLISDMVDGDREILDSLENKETYKKYLEDRIDKLKLQCITESSVQICENYPW